MTKTIVEALTVKNPGEVAGDDVDPPEVLDTIPVYKEFFAEHEKFQRIHVHLVGLRVRDPSEDSDAGVFKASWFKTPRLTVETYGEDTGSTDYFPVGKHSTLKSQTKKGPTPVWDVKLVVIGKKETTEGIKISVSGKKDQYSFDSPASEFPAIGEDWKELVHTPAEDDATNVDFVYKVCISDCAERTVSQEDVANFLQSTDTVEYSEAVIDADKDADKAVLQIWKHKEPAKKAVLWHLGRNDCFMHPHVANPLFIDNGYDIYVLNYSANGLCNRFGFVDDPNLRSHNNIKDFNLYLSQIEKSIEMMKDGTSYDKVIGYAHSTGGPVLINYLLERGDDAFDGFIFNAPFLEWGSMNFGGSQLIEDMTLFLLNNHPDPDKKWGTASTPEELKETPVVYKDTEVVVSAWSAKLWSSFFFDWRSRPLHNVATTTGFAGGVSKVHKKLVKRAKKHHYATLKPLIVLSSRGDDVLQSNETLTFVDGVGPARVEIELGYNSHDVFLSSEVDGVGMAVNFIKSWMDAKGFA
ncbi:unnamed protein product [Cylindrotheca closterium]|uniref:Serine aminopeptidase S33 domain-containing protein n=1 Tax=Cylindrotheca closterium TaxID=2856 RepID=A0AAD2CHW7_9STRA|nr:unnamed protein product [Cylindrotheca closterium]